VQVLEYGQLKDDGAFYFIDMELCDVTLENYLKGETIEGLLSWETIREDGEVHKHGYKIVQHIVNGLLYIHCLREVHRDLSPHNGTLRVSFQVIIVSTFQRWILEDC
jgi:serine/threonine protein kinase